MRYDPAVLSRAELERFAAREGSCVTKQYAETPEIRAVDDQKEYLRRGALARIPLTEAQACRLNRPDPTPDLVARVLSPRQRALLAAVRRTPEAPWPDHYGRALAEAWEAMRAQMRALASQQD